MNNTSGPAAAERTRVLFLEASTGLGGSGSFLYYLLRRVDHERFDVRLSTYLAADTYHLNTLKALGIPYVPLSGRRRSFLPGDLAIVQGCRIEAVRKLLVAMAWAYKAVALDLPLVYRLVRVLKSERVAVVVLNNDVHYHPVGIVASHLAGVPCIVRKAGGIGHGKWAKRLLTRWVDVFVPISTATEVDQLRNPATKRVVRIPATVDLARFDAGPGPTEARARLGLPGSGKVIGTASRLETGKGQEEFIRAAALVAHAFPDVTFYVAGSEDPADPDSRILERLQGLARALGVADRIVFGGWRDDMPTVMAALDVFVHCPTTTIEGLGITNLEAMASGKPTIVSDNGGLPDAVVDGVTGFIVPPGDVDALAQAMLRLLRNPELSGRLGRNARTRVEERFEVGQVTKAFERLIGEYAGKVA